MKKYEKPVFEAKVFDIADKNMALVSGNYTADNFKFAPNNVNKINF